MGVLSKEFEEPAYWDQQRERRIFMQHEPGVGWGIYWMRGYAGTMNKLNRFKSIPECEERQFTESHLRRMAKEKGWSEMYRCPACRRLVHGAKGICFICKYK